MRLPRATMAREAKATVDGRGYMLRCMYPCTAVPRHRTIKRRGNYAGLRNGRKCPVLLGFLRVFGGCNRLHTHIQYYALVEFGMALIRHFGG